MNNKKFLLVSPMTDIGSFLPLNISLIASVLINAGFQVKIFDTTFYEMKDYEGQRRAATDIGMFKPVDWSGYGMDDLKTDCFGDFKKIISEFKPDIIGVSIFTSFNALLAMEFINSIPDSFTGEVIVGGMHVLVDLEAVKKNKKITAILIGECEDVILDAIDFIVSPYKKRENCIPNLICRDENNNWVDSGKRAISNIENIPYLNWDYFDDRNFYRPFDGKVLRMGHVEMARGCPFKCSYCVNELFQKQFKNFWRVKSVKRMLNELDYLKTRYKLDAVKIWDDNLFALDLEKIRSFAKGIKKIGIKFLCHSRPEFVSEEKVRCLAESGCIQVGIGVESGNPAYRQKMLGRRMSNQAIIGAFKLCRKYRIKGAAYIMIGLPDETKEDIMMSARLLREANPSVIVHAIYVPYKGNSLYEYAKGKGYVGDHIDYTSMIKCYLEMPSITKDEVERLFNAFVFYSRFDDSIYPLIDKSGSDPDIFRMLKQELSKYQ